MAACGGACSDSNYTTKQPKHTHEPRAATHEHNNKTKTIKTGTQAPDEDRDDDAAPNPSPNGASEFGRCLGVPREHSTAASTPVWAALSADFSADYTGGESERPQNEGHAPCLTPPAAPPVRGPQRHLDHAPRRTAPRRARRHPRGRGERRRHGHVRRARARVRARARAPPRAAPPPRRRRPSPVSSGARTPRSLA